MNKRKPAKSDNFTRRPLRGITDGQEDFIRSIQENTIILCSGPAGSGKTSLAIGCAIYGLLAEKYERVIIARPNVEAGETLGALPGTAEEKLYPYLLPCFEEIRHYASHAEINGWKNEMPKRLEVCPVAHMRGRNFHNAFIVLDEASNASFEQLKLVITRIGKNSKLVIVGDFTQSDLPRKSQGGLKKLMEILENIEQVGVVRLNQQDIVRNPIIQKILEKLEQYENKNIS